MENIMFEDVFDVQKRDPDGKKFDKGGFLTLRPSAAAAEAK